MPVHKVTLTGPLGHVQRQALKRGNPLPQPKATQAGQEQQFLSN